MNPGIDGAQEWEDPHASEDRGEIDADIPLLKQILGEPFVNWVLAAPFERLSPAQLEVAAALTRVVREVRADHPDHTMELVVLRLSSYIPKWEKTFVEGLRQRAGGRPFSEESTGDQLQDAIVELAVQSYGELLLPTGAFAPSLSSNLMSPVGSRVVAAVRSEGIFPGAADDWGSESTVFGTSLGFAAGQQAAFFGSAVVLAAWDNARLQDDYPSLPDFLSEVRTMLNQTRALIRGEEVNIPSLVGLTGVVLDPGVKVLGPWGCIRQARPGDYPHFANGMTQRRTNATTEADETIEISDAGEVVLETSVPYRLRVQPNVNLMMESTTTTSLETMVERARIALALSWEGGQIPVVLPTWRRTISFMTASVGYWSDPQLSTPRHPTKLTQAQLEAWGYWLGSVSTDNLAHLRLAVTRTLRALTERRDQDDMLIDAVIAWESLFGAKTDSTLRVSAALACLLYPPGSDRDNAQRRYSKIYNTRSEIVHASIAKKTTPAVISDDAREAAQVAIRALRKLLSSRADLIPFESSSRSVRLLLEGPTSETSNAEDPPSENAPREMPAASDGA